MLTNPSSNGGIGDKEKGTVKCDNQSSSAISYAMLLPRVPRYSTSSSLGTGRKESNFGYGTDITLPHKRLYASITLTGCETSASDPGNHRDHRSPVKTTPG